jgi:hypothetical protein
MEKQIVVPAKPGIEQRFRTHQRAQWQQPQSLSTATAGGRPGQQRPIIAGINLQPTDAASGSHLHGPPIYLWLKAATTDPAHMTVRAKIRHGPGSGIGGPITFKDDGERGFGPGAYRLYGCPQDTGHIADGNRQARQRLVYRD